MAKEAADNIIQSRGKTKGKMSAFNFFIKEKFEDRKAEDPNVNMGKLTKELAPLWNNLNMDDRKKFNELAQQDALRWVKQKEDEKKTKNLSKMAKLARTNIQAIEEVIG